MEIIRSVGTPLCPVQMEAMSHLAERIDEFYDQDLFIISHAPHKGFYLSIKVDNEIITLQEIFHTVDSALLRIEFCNRLGIEGRVKSDPTPSP